MTDDQRLTPEPHVNSPRFISQHRSKNSNGLDSPLEQVATRNQKVRAGQHREIWARKTVNDCADSRPVHLPYAHGTRLATRVQDCSPDLIARQLSDGRSHEVRFGVRGRVALGDDRVRRGEDNLVVQYQKGAERMVASGTRLAGECNGLSDELVVRDQRLHHESKRDDRYRKTLLPGWQYAVRSQQLLEILELMLKHYLGGSFVQVQNEG